MPKNAEIVRSSSLWSSWVPQMKRTEPRPLPQRSRALRAASTIARVVREAEVVVGGEHQDLAAVDADAGPGGPLEDPLLLEGAGLLQGLDLGAAVVDEGGAHDRPEYQRPAGAGRSGTGCGGRTEGLLLAPSSGPASSGPAWPPSSGPEPSGRASSGPVWPRASSERASSGAALAGAGLAAGGLRRRGGLRLLLGSQEGDLLLDLLVHLRHRDVLLVGVEVGRAGRR